MTRTKRKKMISKERKRCNPDNVCLKCGEPLGSSPHHFFCKDCWVPGLMYSDEVRKKSNELKK